MKAIDLFAGCGGLSIGFQQSNYKIIKAVEYDEMVAATYMNNHKDIPVIVDDIRNINVDSIFQKGETDVIIGGPPCQGFSMAGARIRQGFIDDPRNYLFKHYFDIVKKVKPKVFIMENVKGLLTMHNGKIFDEIVSIFRDKEQLDGDVYNIEYRVVNAMDFGIPQNRERVIIIGVLNSQIDLNELFVETKSDIKRKYLEFFDSVNVWDAISNLGKDTKSGDVSNMTIESNYQKYLMSNYKVTKNHIATKHSQKAIDRMKKIKNGENWTALDEDIKSVHSGAYGRLEKTGVAPTITTRFDTPSGGNYIHPVENRTITPREAARIQSFPDDYIFYGTKSSICRQVGNAVPPKLSFFLAELVRMVIS